MNNIKYSFLLTFLSGLSTLIGYLTIFIKRKNQNKIIVSALAFASGVMICTSIIDLIPESLKLLKKSLVFPCTIIISFLGIVAGVFLSMIINNYQKEKEKTSSLYRIGIISMITILLHNIPEGIATYLISNINIKIGINIAIAIAMHNIPEGISIAIPIYYSTKSKKKAFLYTLIASLAEPLGALISFIFLKNIINNIMLGILFAVIGGIMLEISLKVLLPSTKEYNEKVRVITFFIIGIFFMIAGLLI